MTFPDPIAVKYFEKIKKRKLTEEEKRGEVLISYRKKGKKMYARIPQVSI